MKSRIVLVAICSLLSLNCRSENPIVYEGSLMPIITGLWVTREDAVGTIAWGNPSYPNPDASVPIPPSHSTDFHVSNIYPNPAQFDVRFRVTIPGGGPVRIWVTTAQLAGELEPSSTSGSINLSSSARIVATILEPTLLQPGVHEIKWELTDNDGRSIAPGFYRIYFQQDEKIIVRDIFRATEFNLGPQSLQELLL